MCQDHTEMELRASVDMPVIQIKSLAFTTSLNLIGSCFDRAKHEQLWIFPVIVGRKPMKTQSLLLWPVVPLESKVDDMTLEDVYDMSNSVLHLRTSRSISKRTKHIVKQFHSGMKGDESSEASSSCDSGSNMGEGSDDDWFEEGLCDLAQDAERRVSAQESADHYSSTAMANATTTSTGKVDTMTLSAVEIQDSLFGADHGTDDEDELAVFECKKNESIVNETEMKRLSTAVQSGKLDMTSNAVSSVVEKLQLDGMSPEQAAVEAALSSANVMGNEDYDDIANGFLVN